MQNLKLFDSYEYIRKIGMELTDVNGTIFFRTFHNNNSNTTTESILPFVSRPIPLSIATSLHTFMKILPWKTAATSLLTTRRTVVQTLLSTTAASSAFPSSSLAKMSESKMSSSERWIPFDETQAKEAREQLEIWPLDEPNCELLNQVHPRNYISNNRETHFDLIAIGAGAGGLVSSKQSARRGAKSALISEKLAGGDCLNVGCVPSKALLRAAKAVAQTCKAISELGVVVQVNGNTATPRDVSVDFPQVMQRLRQSRAKIAPADGHSGTEQAGAKVFQGRGILTGPNSVQVNGQTLTFDKCVLAMGGRPSIPPVEGLKEAPYTTNESLFNLQTLPRNMIVLGAGVIALEMAQTFSLLGSDVKVVNRSTRLFESKNGDKEAAELMQKTLEQDGVTFLSKSEIEKVETIDRGDGSRFLPRMKVTIGNHAYECDCLLVATGRAANVEGVGLDDANVKYEKGRGITVNDNAQSVSNPNIYAVGDCCAGVPRLTHMSGEMAKLVVQNALAHDDWKLSSLVVPAVAYTEPEYATVGIASEDQAKARQIPCDVYRTGLEGNDRAILEGNNVGFVKVVTKKDTDEILGATIVAERAGEMINEISLAMKNKLGLYAIGRNIHPYPSIGEAVMGCGVQYINKKLPRFD
jgi:pyruvate/2-oxoglutarate dehydrogenase complex dihydrolipoamide dehydrogenase (E3) component